MSQDLESGLEPVRYEVTGAVATITFNRPDAMNALDVPTKEALLAALRSASADESVRAVVLTGTGRAFCVGQDLREHIQKLNSGDPPLSTVRDHYNPITLAIAEMPKPTIAALNGVAAGAGAAFAFACDLRIAADTASFTLAFAQVGLSADSGASWTLPRLVGTAKAIELLFNPQKIGVREASLLGLVNEVVPADRLAEHVAALAERLAAGPTVSYAALKASVNYGASHSLAETLEFEDAMQTKCGATADHREAVDAFLAKRAPDFLGK
ncbi:MAG TPA: enoyl-CoA hydratase-related protein [Actinocrinis sp.]|uniref:enoyl-CoA hydratase/isomerase family protein n=1 Tax=Actinocrinis sp. TaxID=1920516 RepID=UPI002D6F4F20|nr:enoyl-CoA hydratase-related protein [Actinocrinis sp.]HZU58088.1 enoyl-CoA hydratase-related protein [Actinocrinis sp.]